MDKKVANEYCFTNDECQSGFCLPKGACSSKLSDNRFSYCTSNAECQSGYCSSNRCVNLNSVACTKNSDCPHDSAYCNGANCFNLKSLQDSCDSSLECVSQICHSGKCVNPSYASCTTSSDCPSQK